VLVPLDGSHLALEALGPAGDLAAALGASVLLLHVVEPPNATLYHHGTRAQLFHPETALAGARRYLHGIAHGVASTQLAAGTDISIRAAIGPPATTVAGVASEEGCDAIAMATHGRGGFARVVLGSVATEVLRRASRPLLLVRPAALRA
jgi:nucleotide-binding universal stress UspA family protein